MFFKELACPLHSTPKNLIQAGRLHHRSVGRCAFPSNWGPSTFKRVPATEPPLPLGQLLRLLEA